MMFSHHSIWHRHPAVRTGNQLTVGEKTADHMKAILATWSALIVVVFFIVGWILINSHYVSGHHFDPMPFILLNLCLSMFAGLQCFVLLIANRRGEQIAAEIAIHTEKNTEAIHELLEQNTELTRQIHEFTTANPPDRGN
jgi:uncharacterized membrane protein